METSKRALARNLKRSLIGITLVGVGLAAQGVSAKPNDKAPEKNQPNVNSVAIYGVEWGANCSTFAVTSSVNEAANTKDISNIVLVCGEDADGNLTWDKWEFDDTRYEFGTELPGGLAPSEGSGCTGAISIAYVKAGSYKSRKGIDGVDPKEFNGYLGGEIPCGPDSDPDPDPQPDPDPEPDPDPQPDPDPEPDTGG